VALTHFEIRRREPYEGGAAFGDTGPYERTGGVAHYATDPDDPANAVVVDLDRAQRDAAGLVRFSGEVTLLRPVEGTRANRLLLMDLVNRGRPVTPGMANRAASISKRG